MVEGGKHIKRGRLHGERASITVLNFKNNQIEMTKKIIIILGHPDSESYCGAIATTYQREAQLAGHDVKLFRLGDVIFDPTLHQGYKKIQSLEPGIRQIQEAILWAEHLVFIYPIWWGAMPALMKGFFDRAFLPGFAFKYRDKSQFWDRLLEGRSGHVISTMDTPPWYYRLMFNAPGHNQIKKTILEFSGVRPVKITSFGPVRFASSAKREQWLGQVASSARNA